MSTSVDGLIDTYSTILDGRSCGLHSCSFFGTWTCDHS